MRSTGEVMGIGRTFGLAFAKSQMAAGTSLPSSGTVFLSLADRDKPQGLEVARSFLELGFDLAATFGTAGYLRDQGSPSPPSWPRWGGGTRIRRGGPHRERPGPAGDQHPRGRGPRADGTHIRAAAMTHGVPCLTTLAAARAAAAGIADWAVHPLEVLTLQEIHSARRSS